MAKDLNPFESSQVGSGYVSEAQFLSEESRAEARRANISDEHYAAIETEWNQVRDLEDFVTGFKDGPNPAAFHNAVSKNKP